jgi:hypothetical protein
LALPRLRAQGALLGGHLTNAFAPIADKLGKIIRMLSSDKDGDVLAAAHALKRTLEGANLDIHMLAAGIEESNGKKFTEADAIEIYQRGVEDGRKAAKQNGTVSVDGEPSWNDIARECAAQIARLQPREREFISDMVAWTTHGGMPTDKQAKWLRSIWARVRR